MKTKSEAVKTLLAAGWTEVEVSSILSKHCPSPTAVSSYRSPSPWWKLLDDDEFLAGTAMVGEWEAWLDTDKQAK